MASTELRAAAQQALEACTDAVSGWQSLAPLAVRRAAEATLDDLRAALAEPENWELRRLREELERCKRVCAATSESWRTDAEKWKAQRDALLEALKTVEWHGQGSCWVVDADKIAAAIAKAEGN